jgi:hypothetical protein
VPVFVEAAGLLVEEFLVEETDCVEAGAADHDTGSLNPVGEEEVAGDAAVADAVPAGCAAQGDEAAVVEGGHFGGDEGAVRMCIEIRNLESQLPTLPNVVVVEEAEELAAGGTDAGVAGGGDSATGLENAADFTLPADPGGGSVGGTVVDHDDFKVAKALGEHARDGFLQHRSTIQGGDDHRNARTTREGRLGRWLGIHGPGETGGVYLRNFCEQRADKQPAETLEHAGCQNHGVPACGLAGEGSMGAAPDRGTAGLGRDGKQESVRRLLAEGPFGLGSECRRSARGGHGSQGRLACSSPSRK